MSASRHYSNDELLRYLAAFQIRGYEDGPIVCVGNFQKRVNIRSQQERAMWLVFLLEMTKRIKPGSRVAIVGAGFAGVSACAAALIRGCQVDIFDQHPQPFYLQRKNLTRKIHPFILDFPLTGFDVKAAGLPILDWQAGVCHQVVSKIERKYNQIAYQYKANLREYLGVDVTKVVKQTDGRIRVEWKSKRENTTHKGILPIRGFDSYDVVILAIGFGLEANTMSYWSNDDLEQVGLCNHKNIWVSGIGDGGLIDLIRALMNNYDVDKFVEFLRKDRNKKLMFGLTDLLAQIRSKPSVDDKTWLFRNFNDLSRSNAMGPLFDQVSRDRRSGFHRATLNGLPDITEMPCTDASLMHLLLIYSFYCMDRNFDYIPGKLEQKSKNTCEVAGKTYEFDRLIIRHGCDRTRPFSNIGIIIDPNEPMVSMNSNIPMDHRWDGWFTDKAGTT